MEIYAYDVESLINLFTATFVNVKDSSDVHVFHIGIDNNDNKPLKKFLQQEMTLVGYNCHSYDDPMIRAAIRFRESDIESIPEELHKLSEKLVSDFYRSDPEILELRYPKKHNYLWHSVDLMRILAFDKLGISLKQTAINLKWYKIQDMPFNHDYVAKAEDLDMILSYNMNDVLITKRLYEEITPLRELREELSKIYHVDLSSASDSKMANLILENIYTNELNKDIRSIRDLRTERPKVLLGNCIAKFVKFQTPQLIELLDRVSSTIVYDYNNYKYSETVYFANCAFSLGVGGLHTEDAPAVYVSDDKYLIQDMDVASYYPNLIINNNFYPQHLGVGFIKVLKKITEERISAKKSGDKVKAQGLKITINSIFGKLGSPTFWLLDAKQMLSTTVTGQMGLLMLVEDLFLHGIEILSCNTDGIVCRIPREKLDNYYEIAHKWEKVTNLELEFTPYKKYVRRDVNAYVTVKENGETKEKGAFLKEVDLKKAYRMPIVAKALSAYFIDGIPVRQTLENCKDIMEFCISQKSASNFSIELHTTKGIEKLQKTNRFYITKKGGSMMKRDFSRTIGLYVGRLVRILNEYDPAVPFEDYQVDLSFYEKEVMKIVDEIEPKQMNLFDLSSLGQSSLKKMDAPKNHLVDEDRNMTIKELNALGKNQIIKKIESIVEEGKIVVGISSRYVYVKSFDPDATEATVYCLAKGVLQTLSVNKPAYEMNGLKAGVLLYCSKFAKLEDGSHSIAEYRIIDKIEPENRGLI